jgi:hypothetical protein
LIDVALEVIDTLVATKKHEIVLLSRKVRSSYLSLPEARGLNLLTVMKQDVPGEDGRRGVTWVKTSYQDQTELREILNGVHTVLSFIVTRSDPGNVSQKNLIDASVQVGVKRFAPSEWAT